MIATINSANQFFFCSSVPPGCFFSLLISGYQQVSAIHLKITISEQEQCHINATKITQALTKS